MKDKPEFAPCPSCGEQSRLAAIAGDCLECTNKLWGSEHQSGTDKPLMEEELRKWKSSIDYADNHGGVGVCRPDIRRLIAEVWRLAERDDKRTGTISEALCAEMDALKKDNERLREALVTVQCATTTGADKPSRLSTIEQCYAVAKKALHT